ncbi:DUF2842 domain-containing protein [Phenylobacterium aquaticum]|uniref:DUF2842 domain-containing protein n=1 Tax=Phenylobacterium aquaticum TaxID=1763816 RepID=UPI0026EA4F30|nr:DUF2842 domain-containing protein [Phenylobacterium aquaticum]
MTARVRKLIGGAGLMAFLAGYIWAATAISDHLPDNMVVKLIFFAVVGIGWGVPILPLLSWMNRGK